MEYQEFVSRNKNLVTTEGQAAIQHTRLLIAGCGIGSVFAETALRLGFHTQILVDLDTVSSHNLNRQNFTHAQVEKHKVMALAERLQSIVHQRQLSRHFANL